MTNRGAAPARNPFGRCVPVVLLLVMAGCTTLRTENRRTLDLCDAQLAPDAATARWLLLPITLPVGLAAGVVDTVLVNPVCALDDAWHDTHDLLWVSREESTLRRVLFTPLAAAATPFVFGSDWLFRVLAPMRTREPGQARPLVPETTEPDPAPARQERR